MICLIKKSMVFAVFVSFAMQAVAFDFQSTDKGKHPIFQSRDGALVATDLDKYNTKENRKIFDDAESRIKEAKKSFGDAFAGSWFEYGENNRARHVIAVAGEVDAAKRKIFSAGDSRAVVNVKYSYAVLEDNQSKIFDYFRMLAGGGEPLVYSVGIDDPLNRVLVRGRASDFSYIESRLRAAGFDLNMIKLEVQDGPLKLTGVVDGSTK